MTPQIHTVTLPDIGEGVAEGEVISWLKQIGDPLAQDEPVVVVMTDKATVELPAPYCGKLAQQYVAAGAVAIRGKPLYDIELTTASLPQTSAHQPSAAPAAAPASPSASAPPKKDVTAAVTKLPPTPGDRTPSPSPTDNSPLATPPVRQLARQMDIDLGTVTPTGKDGRITEDDLRAHCRRISSSSSSSTTAQQLHLSDDEEIPLAGIRSLMAKRMSESKAHIPHFSYFEQVDATRLIQLRGNVKRQADNEGLQVTYVPFILRALSLCITKYPLLNSSYAETEQKIIVHHQHNIGIAVSTPHGLIVPVIKGVQEMTLEQIIRTYNLLVYNAQHNKLSPNDMKGSTITLSNYGGIVKGGLWATPIINYPEAAILALARIHKQPIEKNGELVIRDVLNLSWSFDHRIIDGDLAARISHLLAQLLQDPAALL